MHGILTCALMMVLTSSAGAAAGTKPEPALGQSTGIKTVTLVTGDRVVLQPLDGPDRIVIVRPGKDRRGTKFVRQVDRGDRPGDAGRVGQVGDGAGRRVVAQALHGPPPRGCGCGSRG